MRKCLALFWLSLACSAPREIGARGTREPVAPTADHAAAARVQHLRECQRLGGDLARWGIWTPSEGGFAAVAREVPRCVWRVVDVAGLVRAEPFVATRRDVVLPFSPSVHPRVELDAASNDGQQLQRPLLDIVDVLERPDGYLVAYDSGEWGGALLFFDLQGNHRETLDAHNTRFLVDMGEGVLVFSGLAHGGSDAGRVSFIRRTAGQWTTQSVELPGAPNWLTRDSDGSVLLVTSDDLLRVLAGPKLEPLHHGRWSGMTPNSLVRAEAGGYYLGFASVVVRLQPGQSGFDEWWLAPGKAESAHEMEGNSP